MLIKALNYLNNNIIHEIRRVEAVCKSFDKLHGAIFLDTSFNFNKEINTIFLMYEDNKLISLLTMFLPTKQEAEISAYTLPEYRGRGYFKTLLQSAIDELKLYGVVDILITCESQSASGKIVVQTLDTRYDFTEYFLRHAEKEDQAFTNYKFHSSLILPDIKDIETIVNLSQDIFNESYEDANAMIVNTFQSQDRIQYALSFENKLVGIGSVSFDDNETSIYGLGILPTYQGRGLGKELLLLILKDLYNKKCRNVTIEVNSENKKAFELYKKNGFKVEISYDYYRRKVM